MNCDVGEHFNLYSTQPEIEQEMLTTLAAYVRQGSSTPRRTPGKQSQSLLAWIG